MWDFLQAVQSSYVIQSVYGGRQASVQTEDLKQRPRREQHFICNLLRKQALPARHAHLPVHQRGQRQVVEQVCEVLPHVGVAVLPQALVVEAVDLRDLPRLVVPSQDGDSLLETHLKQEAPVINTDQQDMRHHMSIITVVDSCDQYLNSLFHCSLS